MDSVYTAPLEIRFSQCDHSGHLGLDHACSLCMDLAGAHAALLGCGVAQLARQGRWWVAVKTLLRLERRPALGQLCQASTWPEPPGRVSSCRDYLLQCGDETLLRARTEWAVLDGAGRLQAARELYAPELRFASERALDRPFRRFPGTFPDPPFADYTVRSTDIDLAGHMNNVAYVRMLLGLFSTAELDAQPLRELELHYRAAAYEGENLLLRRRDTPEGLELEATKPAGEPVLLARLLRQA